jgi:hypothetical protein
VAPPARTEDALAETGCVHAGPENVYPTELGRFESFAGEFGKRFDADDGPTSVDAGGTA